MRMIPGPVAEAARQGNLAALREFGVRGGRARAHNAALSRSCKRNLESDTLDQRIERLKILVATPWVVEDARIAALRGGYDALAD